MKQFMTLFVLAAFLAATGVAGEKQAKAGVKRMKEKQGCCQQSKDCCDDEKESKGSSGSKDEKQAVKKESKVPESK